jgi:hypothetical protein
VSHCSCAAAQGARQRYMMRAVYIWPAMVGPCHGLHDEAALTTGHSTQIWPYEGAWTARTVHTQIEPGRSPAGLPKDSPAVSCNGTHASTWTTYPGRDIRIWCSPDSVPRPAVRCTRCWGVRITVWAVSDMHRPGALGTCNRLAMTRVNRCARTSRPDVERLCNPISEPPCHT